MRQLSVVIENQMKTIMMIIFKSLINNIKTTYLIMYKMSTDRTRIGKRWNVNECLQLQREFELLNLSIDEIAVRHKRTAAGIMNKLAAEGLADYNVLYSNYYELNDQMPVYKTSDYEEVVDYNDCIGNDDEYTPEDDEDEDEDEDDYNIKEHLLHLEKQVMALTEMFMNKSKNSKTLFSMFA